MKELVLSGEGVLTTSRGKIDGTVHRRTKNQGTLDVYMGSETFSENRVLRKEIFLSDSSSSPFFFFCGVSVHEFVRESSW